MSCYNYFLKKVQAIPRVEKGEAELLGAGWLVLLLLSI
jgi:hypothetical protein